MLHINLADIEVNQGDHVQGLLELLLSNKPQLYHVEVCLTSGRWERRQNYIYAARHVGTMCVCAYSGSR